MRAENDTRYVTPVTSESFTESCLILKQRTGEEIGSDADVWFTFGKCHFEPLLKHSLSWLTVTLSVD